MSERESYYEYVPSVAAGGIFVALFAILFVYHLFLLLKTRTWFCIPLVVGAIFEVIGFACRILGKSKPNKLILYIMQSLLILLAPILFAASAYMFLARIIRATNTPQYSIVRINWVTKIFVGGDILCFLFQAAGGGILASADSQTGLDVGKAVILVGLCLQMVIFGFFVFVAAAWQRRMNSDGTKERTLGSFNWLFYLQMLYIVSILITVRNLFRVIEYGMGSEAYLLANEWPLYVFDALLMFLVLVICTRWYIREIMEAAQSENGHMEIMLEPDH